MQGLDILLFDGLLRNKGNMRLTRCSADRFSVVAVVLLPTYERLHILRADQLHFVSERFEYARPVECSRAGFEDDRAPINLREDLDELIAHYSALQHDVAAAVHAVELVFIYETWTTTNMARKCGRARKGERLRADVPHGHWKTTTFVAGLRRSGMVAPMVLDGPINRNGSRSMSNTFLSRHSSRATSLSWTISAATRGPPCAMPSRRQARSCFTCRHTAPTSIRSKKPFRS